MERPLAPNGILETAIYADDIDAVAEFYTSVFGLSEIARLADRHVFLRCGSSILLIFDSAATRDPSSDSDIPPHGTTGAGHFCFSVKDGDVGQWAHYLSAHEISIEADLVAGNGSRHIYVRDPAGNSVEIAETKLWERLG